MPPICPGVLILDRVPTNRCDRFSTHSNADVLPKNRGAEFLGQAWMLIDIFLEMLLRCSVYDVAGVGVLVGAQQAPRTGQQDAP
jgi:hypothetical protein